MENQGKPEKNHRFRKTESRKGPENGAGMDTHESVFMCHPGKHRKTAGAAKEKTEKIQIFFTKTLFFLLISIFDSCIMRLLSVQG